MAQSYSTLLIDAFQLFIMLVFMPEPLGYIVHAVLCMRLLTYWYTV
jgi:hypothetical protein